MQKNNNNNRRFSPERPWCVGVAVVGLLVGAMLMTVFASRWSADTTPIFCKTLFGPAGKIIAGGDSNPTELQLLSIVHYATSRTVPQQNIDEIKVTLDVLKVLSPCNFLVYGLGHDSLMWASLNARGSTLFLEEDPSWVKKILEGAPYLRAEPVKYRTQLSEAEELLNMYRSEPDCWHDRSFLKGNERCKLALNMLPEEVYEKEWDLIMIDAPRGYFPAAPGRMAAIYSAAVMARNRKKSGVTHVFLHDVDRKVEKVYAEMFLCRKNLVKGVGRLWHFEIPPTNDVTKGFC
ncbi:hypothetical protein M9H77_10329 [Catharanthus roseus]|uniref:Uncharacterized protein n=1 Tax=Catharanthus roseus TaxID=4058 RepID=A0ACC0C3G9_CATRO|nr:hypothetical protein M9H77_10329 [Catharanthus roseus]